MRTLNKISCAVAIALCSANSFAYHYIGLNLTSSSPQWSKIDQRVHYPHIVVGVKANELFNLEFGFTHTHYNKDDLNLKFRTLHLTALASAPLDGDNFKLVYGVGVTKVVKHQVRYDGACIREKASSFHRRTEVSGCNAEEYDARVSEKGFVPLRLEKEKFFPHVLVGVEKLLIPNLYLRALFSWHNYRAISTSYDPGINSAQPSLNNLHLFTVGLKYTFQ